MRGIAIADRVSDFGAVPPTFNSVDGTIYNKAIDSLHVSDGGTSPLENFDTKVFATGAKIEIVIGDPPAEQDFKLLTGPADPSVPYDEIDAYNSDTTSAARHWKKVGGY